MTTETMTDDQIRQWIEACNHEPARDVLRGVLSAREHSQTEQQRTDLIVQAITTAPKWGAGYGWSLRFGENFRTHLGTGHWPRDAGGLAFLKKATGLDLIPDYKTMHTRGQDDHGLVTEWVRAKVTSLPRLTRGQYLARLHKIGRTGGMGPQRVTHKLDMKFNPPPKDEHGNPNYSLLVGGYVDVTLKWWGDGSLTISSEDVGANGELFQLYQWEGCEHQFDHRLISNCYHGYKCKLCGHSYNIDSGD